MEGVVTPSVATARQTFFERLRSALYGHESRRSRRNAASAILFHLVNFRRAVAMIDDPLPDLPAALSAA